MKRIVETNSPAEITGLESHKFVVVEHFETGAYSKHASDRMFEIINAFQASYQTIGAFKVFAIRR